MEETMSNPGSDLSPEDELLTALDYKTVDSGDEDLLEERQWHFDIVIPIISSSLVSLVCNIQFHLQEAYRLIIFSYFLMSL